MHIEKIVAGKLSAADDSEKTETTEKLRKRSKSDSICVFSLGLFSSYLNVGFCFYCKISLIPLL